MICKKCKMEIDDNVQFCPFCGEKVVDEVRLNESYGGKKPAKCWSVFAKVGKILGIVSLATSWIPFLIGFCAGFPGIVFSCLGNKANDYESIKNKKSGLVMSIIGTVVSFVWYIVFIVIIATM